MLQAKPFPRLTARSTISQLARHPILFELDGAGLIVLFRLLTDAGPDGHSKIANKALWPGDPRAVVRALRKLEQLGIVKIDYAVDTTRTIEVL